MARPNQPRKVFAEDNLAARITYERNKRGWSASELARRMTDAGCPLQPSAITKIETQTPRRRIVVDEFIAFCTVFGLSRDEMLAPIEMAYEERLTDLAIAYSDALADMRRKEAAYADALETFASAEEAFTTYPMIHPEARPLVEAIWDKQVARTLPPGDFATAALRASHLSRMTQDSKYDAELERLFKQSTTKGDSHG